MDHYSKPNHTEDLRFVVRVLRNKMPFTPIKFWLENDEFQIRAAKLRDRKVPVTESDLLEIMVEIYNEKSQKAYEGAEVDFNFRFAKRAIKILSRSEEIHQSGE